MTLLTEHIEAGWREVQSGEFGKWVAERLHSRPGATSSTIRVEAETSGKLQEAVSLRQSQLEGTEERAKDTITNDGSAVTGEQHESLKTEGLAVAGAEGPLAPADAAVSAVPESQSTQSGEADPTGAGEPAADSASTSEATSSTPEASQEPTSSESTSTDSESSVSTEAPSADAAAGVTPTVEGVADTETAPAAPAGDPDEPGATPGAADDSAQ